jgi:hypothetical protein
MFHRILTCYGVVDCGLSAAGADGLPFRRRGGFGGGREEGVADLG